MNGGHIWYQCKADCEGCQFCDGGLDYCVVCTAGEGELPKKCPGRPMTYGEKERVYGKMIDFEKGGWITINEVAQGK